MLPRYVYFSVFVIGVYVRLHYTLVGNVVVDL